MYFSGHTKDNIVLLLLLVRYYCIFLLRKNYTFFFHFSSLLFSLSFDETIDTLWNLAIPLSRFQNMTLAFTSYIYCSFFSSLTLFTQFWKYLFFFIQHEDDRSSNGSVILRFGSSGWVNPFMGISCQGSVFRKWTLGCRVSISFLISLSGPTSSWMLSINLKFHWDFG